MLTQEACQRRLSRFREILDQDKIGVAVISNYRNIYYLSGHLREVEFPQFLIVGAGDNSVLITDKEPERCTSDEIVTYEVYSTDWPASYPRISENAVRALTDVLSGMKRTGIRRLGLEKDRLSALALESIGYCFPAVDQFDVGPSLYRLRKRKDPDEINLIQECVRAIEAGYGVASTAIRPGATELDVFKEVHGEIVRSAGYNLKFDADFACGTRAITEGGTPLRREISRNDLYIIDIYPSYHGYHGDLCRTFAASSPTEAQLRAWEIARNSLTIAEDAIRPGVAARDVWRRLRDYIDSFEFVRGSFWHHAGHGIGLDPQEPPWIIPGSDHVFEIGDVIAVEPGCYSEALRGGVRLECDYIVREDGVDNLSRFPLNL